MASTYVKDLKNLGERLESEGLPVSSAICLNAAVRMEQMEIRIVEAFNWRPFKEGSYPDKNEEILMQLDCDQVIITHFDIEDTETFEQEGVVRWFRFPTPDLYVMDDPIMKEEEL